MYFAEVMDQKEKLVDEDRSQAPNRVQQPVLRRSDPSPLAHALVVLIFVGLLLGLTLLTTSREHAAEKTRAGPRQMPMVHMDR